MPTLWPESANLVPHPHEQNKLPTRCSPLLLVTASPNAPRPFDQIPSWGAMVQGAAPVLSERFDVTDHDAMRTCASAASVSPDIQIVSHSHQVMHLPAAVNMATSTQPPYTAAIAFLRNNILGAPIVYVDGHHQRHARGHQLVADWARHAPAPRWLIFKAQRLRVRVEQFLFRYSARCPPDRNFPTPSKP
jgi:hypothetical protein